MNAESVGTEQEIQALAGRENLIPTVAVVTSLALLVLSSADTGVAGGMGKILWVASVAGLALIHPVLAVAAYVFSAALFAGLHFGSWGSVLERPDNFALAVLLLTFLWLRLGRKEAMEIATLGILMALFIAYGLGQSAVSGAMTRADFASFMRAYGLPFLIFLLLKGRGVSRSTLRIFMAVMIALGIYMAAVSIMEKMDLWPYIIPPWVGDAQWNLSMGTGRSGGLLMQAEFNGLALNMIYCLLLGSAYWFRKGRGLFAPMAGALLLAGIFVTYTRAAWIGALLASLLLFQGGNPAGQGRLLKRIGFAVGMVGMLGVLILMPGRYASERAGDKATIYFRLNLWVAGLRMAAQNPIFGHGFGGFREKVSAYQGESTIGGTREIGKAGTLAHNTMINVLVEHGLGGFILYLLILGGMAAQARQGMASIWPRGSVWWIAAFVGTYVVNTSFINAHELTPNLIFCSVLGILSGLKNGNAEGTAGEAMHGKQET